MFKKSSIRSNLAIHLNEFEQTQHNDSLFIARAKQTTTNYLQTLYLLTKKHKPSAI